MRNPLRSEADAFRFLLGTLAYFGLIAIAATLGGRWVGLAVFVVLSGLVVGWWIVVREEPAPPVRVVPRGHAAGERRILVVANETVAGEALRDVIETRAENVREEVLVVCPALNSPVRHWASDDSAAQAAARARLERSLAQLREAGVDARGEIGDGDPLQAIEDALRTFGADEIIISTHPEGRSHWLERGVVDRARARFDAPIRHVVVDLAAESERVG